MDSSAGMIFLGAESAILFMAALAILRIGFMRLESPLGILRDGIRPGKRAPAWQELDSQGRTRGIPTRDRWQFLLFGDRSLVAFPGVVEGANYLAAHEPELDVLVLSRDSAELCHAAEQGLGLRAPVIPVSQSTYHRFNVRVMPLSMIIDPGGVVKWVALVNNAEQMIYGWETCQALEHRPVEKA